MIKKLKSLIFYVKRSVRSAIAVGASSRVSQIRSVAAEPYRALAP
jgi:hypothetical protein